MIRLGNTNINKSLLGSLNIPTSYIGSIIDTDPVDITNWDVNTGADPIVSYSVTTSSLGMVENNQSEASSNTTKLINGIVANPNGIDVNGVYYIETGYINATTVRLSSSNRGELKSNNASTVKLFDCPNLVTIESHGVVYTDEYAGGGDLRLFFEPSQNIDTAIFRSNEFNGNIQILHKDFGSTQDPDTYGMSEFIFRNNTISNSREIGVELPNVPIAKLEIVNNEIHNLDANTFSLGVSNAYNPDYNSDLTWLRPLFTVTDNYVHNDLTFIGQPQSGAYMCPFVLECDKVYYYRNWVEGIWSTEQRAIYDCYLSANTVTYKNNVNKNNITFNDYKSAGTNTLMKAKGCSEFEYGGTTPYAGATRDYQYNHFIVEESWIDQVVALGTGALKADAWVIYAQLSVTNNNIPQPMSAYIRNNTFDVYSLVCDMGYNMLAINYETYENVFNLDYTNGIFTETVLLRDDNVANSVIFRDNEINVSTGINQSEVYPAMVKLLDNRSANTDKIGSINFNNNFGTVPNILILREPITDSFTMTGNNFNLDSASYPVFQTGEDITSSTMNNNVWDYNGTLLGVDGNYDFYEI